MPTCHILLSQQEAVDLLGSVDHAASSLQAIEPLTLLPLDLIEASDAIFLRVFGHLLEGEA